MSTKLSMTRDINSYNAFGVFPTYDIFAGSLAANSAQSIDVPSNQQYWLAIFTFSPGEPFTKPCGNIRLNNCG